MTNYQKLKLALFTFFIFGFLFLIRNYTENGRYVFAKSLPLIIDTRTGDYFSLSSKKKTSLGEFQGTEKIVGEDSVFID